MDSPSDGSPAGRVVGLWRYPVKSMGAEALTEVAVSWHGLAGDRRWAFVRNGQTQSGFPWLTLRDCGDMSHYKPLFVEPTRPDPTSRPQWCKCRRAQTVGMPPDIRRLRPNILVEAMGETAFPEDHWVGRVLRLGTPRMRADKRDGRCLVITIDPVTTERHPLILRAVANDRQGGLVVHGSTAEPVASC